jgi:hypothetical protein
LLRDAARFERQHLAAHLEFVGMNHLEPPN